MIYLQLFWSFLQVGLFSVGGGYVAIPLIRDLVVVQNSWLSMNEFTDLVTIAEMTPGPIIINAATFVGIRVAGPVGAIAATVGSIFPALILVSILAFVYYRFKGLDLLQSVLGSLRPAVVSLIASAGISILLQVAFAGQQMTLANLQWTGLVLFAAAFTVLRRKKPNPILVMSLCGVGGLIFGLLGLVTI